MKILAIDSATRTGWACIANDVRTSGVMDFSIRTKATKTIEADHPGKRFANFQNWLRESLRISKPSLIVYERIVGGIHAGGKASLIEKGLEALILNEAYRGYEGWSSIPVWSFAAASIKKWGIGSGLLTNESKIAMTAAAFKHFSDQEWVQTAKGVDDNQADALWILDLAVAVHKKCMVDGINPLEISDNETLTKLAGLVTLTKWRSNVQ